MWRQAVPRALVPAREGLRKLRAERGSAQTRFARRSRAVLSEAFRLIGVAVHEAWRASLGFGRVRAQSRDALRLAGTGLLSRARRGRALAYGGASIAAAAARTSLDSVHGAFGGTALVPSRLGAALPLRLGQALLRSPAARRIEWRGIPLSLGIAGAAVGAVAAGFLIVAHGPLTPTQAPPLARAQGATATAAETGPARAQPAIVQEARSPAQLLPTRVQAPPHAIPKEAGRAEELAAAEEPDEPAAAPAAIETSSAAPEKAAALKPQAPLPAPLLEPAVIPAPKVDAPPAPKPKPAPAVASLAPPHESGAIKKAPKPAAEVAAVPLAPPVYPRPRGSEAASRTEMAVAPRAVTARERWFSPYDGPEYDYANRQSQ
jgi:hypothetical protein